MLVKLQNENNRCHIILSEPITMELLKKKWIYHFLISEKTNIIEKPEWYLNQTLKWIHEHIDNKDAEFASMTKRDFILSMVELASTRLNRDIDTIKAGLGYKTEIILIHTYNEVIAFTKVVNRLLGDNGVPSYSKHDLMSVFSDQILFEQIIAVEEDYAQRMLNQIKNMDGKWDPVLEGEFHDPYKIPQCADRFLLLIRSLTERVECFKQLDCQYQLIELQCNLFRKFLNFLKKSSEPVGFFGGYETTEPIKVKSALKFLKLILDERSFIPKSIKNLDKNLIARIERLTSDYSNEYDRVSNNLIELD